MCLREYKALEQQYNSLGHQGRVNKMSQATKKSTVVVKSTKDFINYT